ncbi:MAG: multidrug efflux SMR transporter [Cytophagales bacterium]|nr:multidrug efflux SMR transporter [Cytophaga sp.]
MKFFFFLILAIVCETIATSSLKASEQFTKLIPAVITIVGYGCSFYFLSLTLKGIPLGTMYALWSGLGIVLVTVVGIVVYKEIPDKAAIIGILFIIVGVIIIQLFSKTEVH